MGEDIEAIDRCDRFRKDVGIATHRKTVLSSD